MVNEYIVFFYSYNIWCRPIIKILMLQPYPETYKSIVMCPKFSSQKWTQISLDLKWLFLF